MRKILTRLCDLLRRVPAWVPAYRRKRGGVRTPEHVNCRCALERIEVTLTAHDSAAETLREIADNIRRHEIGYIWGVRVVIDPSLPPDE